MKISSFCTLVDDIVLIENFDTYEVWSQSVKLTASDSWYYRCTKFRRTFVYTFPCKDFRKERTVNLLERWGQYDSKYPY